ncbi:hypothetical protein B5X24_HaOG216279 [Helicoverpa armigera]|nr:hypothetical protein B5X24_HaOG216279 [Helicoverpa armigera]
MFRKLNLQRPGYHLNNFGSFYGPANKTASLTKKNRVASHEAIHQHYDKIISQYDTIGFNNNFVREWRAPIMPV